MPKSRGTEALFLRIGSRRSRRSKRAARCNRGAASPHVRGIVSQALARFAPECQGISNFGERQVPCSLKLVVALGGRPAVAAVFSSAFLRAVAPPVKTVTALSWYRTVEPRPIELSNLAPLTTSTGCMRVPESADFIGSVERLKEAQRSI